MHLSVKMGVLSALLLMFVATITLTGCRVTGGSSGSKKSVNFEKPIKKVAAADVALVLDSKLPKSRFRVDVRSAFGNYKKTNRSWTQTFSLVSRDKHNNVRLKVSIYGADGVTLLTEKNTTAYYSPGSNGYSSFFKTKGLDNKLHSDYNSSKKLPVNCSVDKKVCTVSYIVDIELVNRQSSSVDSMSVLSVKDRVYFESKVQIDAHKDCFTFLACIDGKHVKSVRPSIKITKIN